MNKLSDYDLISGDWVKKKHGWLELKSIRSGSDGKEYTFFNNECWLEYAEVEAVLRPSVIIRDILDKTLERLKQDCHTCKYTQPYLVFDIIHPKERKKSLKEKCSLNYPMDALDVFNTFHLLCEEIEELKKGDK